MGRAGPKGYQQVFIHTPHSGAATLEALLNQQRNTFVGIGIGAGVCPLNSGLAFTPQTGRHFLFGPPFFFWGSLVSWSAQADHCGMITCERFVPTPHAPCCQESGSTVGVHGTLALRATSRCLFTIDITKVIYAGLPVDISVFLCFAQATAKIRPRPAHGLF